MKIIFACQQHDDHWVQWRQCKGNSTSVRPFLLLVFTLYLSSMQFVQNIHCFSALVTIITNSEIAFHLNWCLADQLCSSCGWTNFCWFIIWIHGQVLGRECALASAQYITSVMAKKALFCIWQKSDFLTIIFEPEMLDCQSKALNQWFPTGGLRSCGHGVMNNSLNSLLKSQIFGTAHISIFCYISKIFLWSSHYLNGNSYLVSTIQIQLTLL